jgi:mannose-6-phosphate isomerase
MRYGPDLVGEDVYLRYGDQFPLLIKLIDAKRDLSVQVHPGDELALRDHGCKGKNEMWYIIDADEGATITTGFKQALTPAEFDRHLAEGTILDVVNRTPSKPGDAFYIPAGQIHAIGAGNLLVEVQQSCDITYRVWDYNRRDADGNLRELHTEQAREALNFETRDGHVEVMPHSIAGGSEVLFTRDFSVDHYNIDGRYRLEIPQSHSFLAITCIQGETLLDAESMQPVTVKQGETVLIPAIAHWFEFTGHAQLLFTAIPNRT